MAHKSEIFLPPAQPNILARFRMKTLLSHFLFRRLVLWSVALIFILSVALFNPQVIHGTRRNVLQLTSLGKDQRSQQEIFEEISVGGKSGDDAKAQVQYHATVETVTSSSTRQGGNSQERLEGNEQIKGGSQQQQSPSKTTTLHSTEDGLMQGDSAEAADPSLVWLKFKHLDGYFRGLRSLVPFSEYHPEYPVAPGSAQPSRSVEAVHRTQLPTPTPYIAQPDYDSAEYRREYGKVEKCYLDDEKKVPVPDIWAYNGVPQGQAEPAIGSYDVLGLRQDVCFDRFGRFGPYGLGYPQHEGGTGEGTNTESEGSDVIWEAPGKIVWEDMDWAAAQHRCFLDNENRFLAAGEKQDPKIQSPVPQAHQPDAANKMRLRKIERIAVVIRTYVGFQWTAHALLNFRAMISELNLRSGGEYDVHFLLHARDNDAPIWADPETAQRILDENVPREFHGICTLWSEAQMKLYYPGDFGESFENPSNSEIHGVYRSAHLPLQHFANMHPEYAHFWNWEMDMRWTGSYYELFDRLGKWAAKQSRYGMWERSSKYYIPKLHGTWDNFTNIVNGELVESGRRAIMGPVIFAGKNSLRDGEAKFLPPSCEMSQNIEECGVGEDADLITLNPLFDVEHSGWVFAGDVTGYDTAYPKPPRRCAIVTASRLSRRLLAVMHEETWRLHHSMFSEMFPPSMAFHHGLKAVYAPHPVYLDRAWPVKNVDKAFNGGRDHTTNGHGSPFDLNNEHNHKGTTWYYNSEFAGLLWRRWLGYAQWDGRGARGGRANEGQLRGGKEEEADPKNSGRMCLRNMLFHPIKWENPSEQD